MFEEEKYGYKKSEVDYYIRRLDEDYQQILKSQADRLENVKRNITELATEISEYSQVVPTYKTEIESLRERLKNIRKWVENASKARFEPKPDYDVILANLINHLLGESDNIHELKLVEAPKLSSIDGADFFEILASNREVKLEDALTGFDFFDNNPYKKSAEKRLAKIEKKKYKRAR